MTIKTTKTVYISDRNQEYFLDEMQFSHLLNAHAHHRKQMDTLEGVLATQSNPPDYVLGKLVDLKSTVIALEREIITRTQDIDKDDEKYRRSDYGY